MIKIKAVFFRQQQEELSYRHDRDLDMNLTDLLQEALDISEKANSKQQVELIQELKNIHASSQANTLVGNKTAFYNLNNLLNTLNRLSINLKNVLQLLVLCAKVSCGQERSLDNAIDEITKLKFKNSSWLWGRQQPVDKTFEESYKNLLQHSSEFIIASLYLPNKELVDNQQIVSSDVVEKNTTDKPASSPPTTPPQTSMSAIQKLLNINFVYPSKSSAQVNEESSEELKEKLHQLTLENKALNEKLDAIARGPVIPNEYFAYCKDDKINPVDLDKIIGLYQSNYEFHLRHERLQNAIKQAMASTKNTNQLPNLAQELIECENLYNTCFSVYDSLFKNEAEHTVSDDSNWHMLEEINWQEIIDNSSNILTSFYGLSKSKPHAQAFDIPETDESIYKKYFEQYDKVVNFKKLKAEFHEEIIKRAENVEKGLIKNLLIHKNFIQREVGQVKINLQLIDRLCREKRLKEVQQNKSVAQKTLSADTQVDETATAKPL